MDNNFDVPLAFPCLLFALLKDHTPHHMGNDVGTDSKLYEV